MEWDKVGDHIPGHNGGVVSVSSQPRKQTNQFPTKHLQEPTTLRTHRCDQKPAERVGGMVEGEVYLSVPPKNRHQHPQHSLCDDRAVQYDPQIQANNRGK